MESAVPKPTETAVPKTMETAVPTFSSTDDPEDVPMENSMLQDTITEPVHNINYKILTKVDICQEMERLVRSVNDVFGGIYSSSVLCVALIKYKWSKDHFVEKFFEKDDGASFFLALHLPKTGKHSKREIDGIKQCGICCEDALLTGFQCGHDFCYNCWSRYLSKLVMENSLLIECPEAKCTALLDNDSVCSLAANSEVKSRYMKLLISSFVQHKEYFSACSTDGCNRFSQLLSDGWTAISCTCGSTYCFQCQQVVLCVSVAFRREPWHYPVDCTRMRKWLKKCSDDSETSNYIMANTKECPKCHGIIEKNGGCNHMTCKNVTCHNEFCWICLGPWSTHGNGFYSCNRFDDEASKKARDTQEQSRAEIARYLHYFNRYANHRLSLTLEKKLVAGVNERIARMQLQGIAWSDAQYLLKAVDVLGECRRIMMYSYVFAYYLKKNNYSEIFEDNQRDLEIATEKLSHMLENDLQDVNLIKLKQEVQDSYRYVDSRKNRMLEHCKEGYERNMWTFGGDVSAASNIS